MILFLQCVPAESYLFFHQSHLKIAGTIGSKFSRSWDSSSTTSRARCQESSPTLAWTFASSNRGFTVKNIRHHRFPVGTRRTHSQLSKSPSHGSTTTTCQFRVTTPTHCPLSSRTSGPSTESEQYEKIHATYSLAAFSGDETKAEDISQYNVDS